MGMELLRYEVGDYVYIREDLKHNKEYGGFIVKDMYALRGRKLKVTFINKITKSYSLTCVGYGVFVSDSMIDHDKTRELLENHFKRKEKRFNLD